MQLINDDGYAERFAAGLTNALQDIGVDWDGVSADEDGNPPEVNTIETFEEAGLLTRDKGLVLSMSDGATVNLIIQAYTPA